MGHWWASVIAGSRGSRIICPTAPQLAMEINWKSGKVADVGVSLGVMNCVRRLANVLVAAMTITGLLVIMSGFACAHVASTAAARQTKNYALFFALVAKMAPEGRLPRLSDPSARDVLNRFWDVSLLGHAPYTGDDLKSLSAIANLQSLVIKKYATFKGVPEQQPTNDARYQDELSHGARMSITAVAAILNGLAAFVAPEIESGSLSKNTVQALRRTQDGMVKSFLGAIKMVSGATMTPEDRHIVAEAMAAAATSSGGQLTVADRQKVILAVAPVLGSADGTTQASLNTVMQVLATSTCTGLCAAVSTTAVARTPAPPAPSGPAQFYPLVGDWSGQGEITVAGQAPARLNIKLSCKKAGLGADVECGMTMKNKQMDLIESDLMGVDKESGTAHWFTVNNQGGAFDHAVKWSDAHTMIARRDWNDHGSPMKGTITVTLPNTTALDIRSVLTSNGKQVMSLSGNLAR